ncbi:cytochrome c oxidase assembly protein [Allohahella sp. A8]|uniref:cytochrome c oxidase assembly protein n=1 Tax=Allohahella sp. A8 TaxID=3141461 RepID=UPI000C0A1000|nr:hypothetical protein [Hahellaceae bacterium]|tara:strand:- start:1987 stop:2838 length:852 start_codon:yes stop_codon:yes gene_type:complete
MHLRAPGAILTAAIAASFAGPACAHSLLVDDVAEQAAGVLSATILAACWLLYLTGSRRRPPRRVQLVCFHSAMVLSVLAVHGPLDGWAERSTSWHMVQHMLFMVVIAPLWVLARPLPQLVATGGRRLARTAEPLLKCARHPMLVAYAHAFIIWFWHTPYFYTLALENPWWHISEHGLFLISAGLLWWVVLRSSRGQFGWALTALLFTLMNTGFLGALLTFANAPLYGDARGLEDQQLAGLIMWVPGGLPYLVASAWIGYRWTLQLQRRVSARSGQPPAVRQPL